MDLDRSSPTPTTSTSTLILTPTTSKRSSTTTRNTNRHSPPLPTTLLGPIPVTTLSAISWRKAYPRVGQFAITASEEVIAAGPRGLFYFKRVQDHASKPWSEARLLSSTPATVNDSFVSGLAIHSSKERLDVYCVSRGVLHSFYRSAKTDPSFAVNSRPPLSTYAVSGTPAVATTVKDPQRWSLVVPCQSGGLLHTSTTSPSSSGSYGSEWDPVDHVAKGLGVISAVSITTIRTGDGYPPRNIAIVAACVASARLHTLEGLVERKSGYYASSFYEWKAQASTMISHPGEVTGNPVLINGGPAENQLDLLVPSAEGGVFHFIRTDSTPDEWHMIARITFPPSLPIASCLALNVDFLGYRKREFKALVQSGGRIYQVKTYEGAKPWSGSYLKPIVYPGPFSD
ncbi:hypothetical protein F4860DRAFT_70741 [Xylaria cubensis]|nr:hypothetical protein F4860DRAFT_70741 [Xylaria cubensis]